MKKSTADRRQAPRRPASGEVRLRQAGLIAPAFAGRLVDMSATGFRARHSCLTLGCGARVAYESERGNGMACAVWTRIVGREAETGFQIIPGNS